MNTRLLVATVSGGLVVLMGSTAMANMQFGVKVVDCETKAPLEGVLVHGFIGSQIAGDDELYDYTDADGYAYLAGANADNVLYCNYQDQDHACAVRFEFEGYQTSYMRKAWINTAEAVNVNGTNTANYYRHYTEEGGHPLDEMTMEICTVNTIVDFDNDGIVDTDDNCPAIATPSQADMDGDGVGDACDNCIDTPNFDQLDGDRDGVGDLCTQRTETIPDSDRDGITNDLDNCPSIPNPDQADGDGNGIGDYCDYGEELPETPTPGNIDTDFDGIPNDADNCPGVPNQDQDPAACAGIPDGNPGTIGTGTPGAMGDSGGNGGGDSVTNPGTDGSTETPGDDNGSVSSGGCAVAGGQTNGGPGALVLVLMGLVFALRRRR